MTSFVDSCLLRAGMQESPAFKEASYMKEKTIVNRVNKMKREEKKQQKIVCVYVHVCLYVCMCVCKVFLNTHRNERFYIRNERYCCIFQKEHSGLIFSHT